MDDIKHGMATVEEAAEFLSMSKSTIQRMLDRGEIEVRRYGRTVRIPWSWLYEQTTSRTSSDKINH